MKKKIAFQETMLQNLQQHTFEKQNEKQTGNKFYKSWAEETGRLDVDGKYILQDKPPTIIE